MHYLLKATDRFLLRLFHLAFVFEHGVTRLRLALLRYAAARTKRRLQRP